MSIFVTSDFHFGHDREFIWKVRGFASVQEMNETMVKRFNDQVGKYDDVYILGDLFLGSADNIRYISQLNGNLHLVRGNHDTDARWKLCQERCYIVEASNAILLNYYGYHIYMSHYPTLTGHLENASLKQMTINFYGHTHQKSKFLEDRPYMYHVGVDAHDCYPVPIETIIEMMAIKVSECKFYL